MMRKISGAFHHVIGSQLRSFERDAALILFSRILQNANGLLLSIIIIRKFGLAAAGSLTISTIGTVILATFLTFGLPYVFARSETKIGVGNSIGLFAAFVALLASLPICAILGFTFGNDTHEALVIATLSLAGAFFAQTTVANSLLVLQNRAADIIFSPVGNLIGLIIGYFAANDFLSFAAILTVCRFIGTAVIFGRLAYARFSISDLKSHFRQGAGFLTADTISLVADQISVMIASAMMTRTDLGTFGLCRQILTVGDTPAWSRLTVWYPALVRESSTTIPKLQREMLKMGVLCGLGLILFSIPLGLWIYHLPHFVLAASLLTLCVPIRYMIATCETSLRALGRIAVVNKLTVIRCLLVSLLPIGILANGLYGAIFAMIAQAVILGWLMKRSLNHCLEQETSRQPMESGTFVGDEGASKVPS
jgi:O-antigen/teichoic acid export membrane protein